ncbi:hydrogenase [Pseudomonas sp. Pseusp122]|uniref:hydrogenase n=1 Tax=unclassified Pseudomonas TaxID=196821 RepID=UPI0039A768C7
MTESAVFMAPLYTAPSVPPLIARLVNEFHGRWIDPLNLESWLAEGGDCLLLLCGDPVRHPECLDVAVVLPELCQEVARRHGRHVRIGVVPREHEETFAGRYALRRWPTLVWLRDGGYVTSIDGMHDWDEYLLLADKAVSASNTLIPLVSASSNEQPGGCQ